MSDEVELSMKLFKLCSSLIELYLKLIKLLKGDWELLIINMAIEIDIEKVKLDNEDVLLILGHTD